MKNFLFFLAGIIITWVFAYRNAEKIAQVKHDVKERARQTKRPTIGVYRWRGRLFIEPGEANYISEKDTFFQYPTRADLEERRGIRPDFTHDDCFQEYVIKRRMTNTEAWQQFSIDHPDLLPKQDTGLKIPKMKRAFFAAMNRRRKLLIKK